MKKTLIFIFVLIIIQYFYNGVDAKKILSDQPVMSSRVHNEQGERVGTVKRENNVFKLYDMHERLVNNPAAFMNQPPDECYLYDITGYAIGKCTSTRVIMWR